MATVYSSQFTRARSGRKADPNEVGGVQQTLAWDFTLPAGNIADVLVCGILPKGSKVLGGNETHTALTSGAGTATGSYGTYLVASDGITLGAVDSAARFLGATSFEAAGNTALAGTQALGYGFETTVDVFVVCVNSVEAFATAGTISGHLTYTRN